MQWLKCVRMTLRRKSFYGTVSFAYRTNLRLYRYVPSPTSPYQSTARVALGVYATLQGIFHYRLALYSSGDFVKPSPLHRIHYLEFHRGEACWSFVSIQVHQQHARSSKRTTRGALPLAFWRTRPCVTGLKRLLVHLGLHRAPKAIK